MYVMISVNSIFSLINLKKKIRHIYRYYCIKKWTPPASYGHVTPLFWSKLSISHLKSSKLDLNPFWLSFKDCFKMVLLGERFPTHFINSKQNASVALLIIQVLATMLTAKSRVFEPFLNLIRNPVMYEGSFFRPCPTTTTTTHTKCLKVKF